jgi:hypothetical protein
MHRLGDFDRTALALDVEVHDMRRLAQEMVV